MSVHSANAVMGAQHTNCIGKDEVSTAHSWLILGCSTLTGFIIHSNTGSVGCHYTAEPSPICMKRPPPPPQPPPDPYPLMHTHRKITNNGKPFILALLYITRVILRGCPPTILNLAEHRWKSLWLWWSWPEHCKPLTVWMGKFLKRSGWETLHADESIVVGWQWKWKKNTPLHWSSKLDTYHMILMNPWSSNMHRKSTSELDLYTY